MIDRFRTVFGVDFSGAKLAGRNTWVAEVAVRPGGDADSPRFALVGLSALERLVGTAEREPALAALAAMIAKSEDALWALDFPFGLPVEVMDGVNDWPGQLAMVGAWEEDAYDLGVEFVRRAKLLGGMLHIRRQTDTEAKTPFDCYHYRIIYQTFHGIRDVLGPMARAPKTAILPFQYRRLAKARRVMVEACPASTLKRLGLPSRNYKQATGGPLTPLRRATRRAIVDGLAPYVAVSPTHQRVMMRNPGGDALDAVIAAVGGIQGWELTDHKAVARHPRYPREGRLYV